MFLYGLLRPSQKPHPPAAQIFYLHVAANQKKIGLKGAHELMGSTEASREINKS